MSNQTQFTLEVRPADASGEVADTLALSLAEELRSLPYIAVERAPGPPPQAGEKAIAGLANELLIQVAGSAITLALPPLVSAVRGWMGRQETIIRPVTVKCGDSAIELAEGTPVEDVVKLMLEASKGAAA
jgi:hypothetical protein